MDDVNAGAVSPDTSSVSQGPEITSHTQPQPAPSAGTQNTDVQEADGGSPKFYERFKEVNDKWRSAESQLQEFKAKQDHFQAYQRLDEMASQNPRLAAKIQAAIQEERAQAQQADQNQWQQGQQQPQQPDVMSPIMRMADNLYTSEFRNYAKQQGIPEQAMTMYEQAARTLITHINPDPIGNFNLSDVPRLFDLVRSNFDSIYSGLQSQYIQQKNNDVLPPSASQTGGIVFKTPAQTGQRQDRASLVAQMMRGGG